MSQPLKSVEGFLTFLRRTPNKTFDWTSPASCAVGQYHKSLGISYGPIEEYDVLEKLADPYPFSTGRVYVSYSEVITRAEYYLEHGELLP